jgi:threonine/homoserine/homoserine lactone efflux protein
MKKAVKRKNRSIKYSTFVEMFFSLLMIPFGLAGTQGLEEAFTILQLASLMLIEFLLLSLTTFLRGIARRYRNDIPRRRKLDFIFAGLFLACAAAILFEPSLMVMTIAGVVFMVSLIPGRVISILRNRKWTNILMNAVLIILILFAIWGVWEGEESQRIFVVSIMLMIAILSLFRIMTVTFARLRLDLLRDIVRKTYAAEIIFGLVLLIASFSFVLIYTDTESFNGEYANALWYCFAVVTTIGFGDMTAVSTIGRILSVILGIYGIIVVALITSIIVNFYGEMKKTGPEDEQALPEAGKENPPEEGQGTAASDS